jgi:hypothetical protein
LKFVECVVQLLNGRSKGLKVLLEVFEVFGGVGKGGRQSDISTNWSITRLRAWLFLFFQGVSASAAIALMTLIKRGFIRL